MSPPFHRFVEPERSQCGLLHFPNKESESQGREESWLGARKLRLRDSLVCPEPQQGGEPQASGAPVASRLKIPHGSLGPLQALRTHGGVWQIWVAREGGWPSQPLDFAQASRQTAIPLASCLIQGFTFVAMILYLWILSGGEEWGRRGATR